MNQIIRRIRIARRLAGSLRKINEANPGVCVYSARILVRRIRRVLTLTQDSILLRLHDGAEADKARRMARLAGCPGIWRGTAWE
jgi:hypothetical protein